MKKHQHRLLQNALARWGMTGAEDDPDVGDAEKSGADAARYLLSGGELAKGEAEDLGKFLLHTMQHIPA